ncbi:hypothetical protein MHK_006474, partial [Candidatus Magnetomorum sp. HK-1]
MNQNKNIIRIHLFNFKIDINKLIIFFYLIVLLIFKLQPVIFQSGCKASMGSITVKEVNVNQFNSSEYISLSRTTIISLANQDRIITINNVTGTLMVTGFSNILTSTTLNSSHNGVVLVSGNTTLTLPNPTTVLGIRYTIKKIDSPINIVTISGVAK